MAPPLWPQLTDWGKSIRCRPYWASEIDSIQSLLSMWPGKPWQFEVATSGHVPRSSTRKYEKRESRMRLELHSTPCNTMQDPFSKTPLCTQARLRRLVLLATKLSLSNIIKYMQSNNTKIRKVEIKFFLLRWCYEVVKQSGSRNRGSNSG